MRINLMPGMVIAAGMLLIGTAAPLTVAAQQPCPPHCGLDIELPANVAEPPRIPQSQTTIKASRGAVMLATLADQRNRPDKAATKLVFRKAGPGEEGEPYTPFVDQPGPHGKPITEVRLRESGRTRLFVRTDDGAPECFTGDGCKYDIVNDGESERPTLDPWIIIER